MAKLDKNTRDNKYKKLKNSDVSILTVKEFMENFKIPSHSIAQSARISGKRFDGFLKGDDQLNEFEINRVRAVFKSYVKIQE